MCVDDPRKAPACCVTRVLPQIQGRPRRLRSAEVVAAHELAIAGGGSAAEEQGDAGDCRDSVGTSKRLQPFSNVFV